jgi:hypothetical protein
MSKEEDSEIEFEDAETYRSKSTGVGIKEIALKQFQKCCEEGSKEMTNGGVMKRLINNEVVELAVPNQRELFINNVEMLRTILKGKINKNKELMKPFILRFDSELERIKNEFNAKKVRLDADFSKKHVRNQYSERPAYNQLMQQYYEEYELGKVKTYKKMLDALSLLIDRLNYFEEMDYSQFVWEQDKKEKEVDTDII